MKPITSESRTGKTPNGGVKSTIYYSDINKNPIDKKFAVRVEIVEFDKDDNEIFRTQGNTIHGS